MTLEAEAGVDVGEGVKVEALAGPAVEGRESREKAMLALWDADRRGDEPRKARPLPPMRRPGRGGGDMTPQEAM